MTTSSTSEFADLVTADLLAEVESLRAEVAALREEVWWLGEAVQHHRHQPDRLDHRGGLVGKVIILTGDFEPRPSS